jgi:hypothetical protein
MKNLFIFVVLALSSTWVLAFVDPENGNNFIEFSDMEPSGRDQGAPYIRRYYNSLTDHKGIFGKGWASDLESKIEFLSDSSVAVVPYGAGRVRVFETQEFKIDPGWKLPDQIDVKEKIIAQLKSDKVFRYKWLKENNYLAAKMGQPFSLMTLGTETLSFKKNQWYFKNSSGETWIFDASGKLVGMNIPGGGDWQITYKNNLPDSLRNNQRIYFISYDSDGLIQKIEFKKTKITYQFLKGYLQGSVDATAQKFFYGQSSIGQLESIKGSGIDYHFTYLPSTGRIIKVVENDSTTTYSYDEKKISGDEVFITTITDNKGVEKVEYTYTGLEKARYLSKLREIKGNLITETQFNSARQPIKIVSPQSIQEIFYDQFGRIIEIKNAGEVTGKITRDSQSGKITEITDRNQLRKFSYNLQGKIATVDLSDGARLIFTYNPDGFIQTADLTDLKGLSEGLLTPIYEGKTVTKVLIDGKVPANSADKLRAIRFYQVIQEATSLPKF